MEIKLACPKCKTDLNKKDETLHCPICKVNYQIIDGIPSFVDMDEFYEGKFTHVRDAEPELNNLLSKLLYRYIYVPLNSSLSISREIRFFKKAFKNRGDKLLILDIACGGGLKLLTNFGSVVGLDLSLSSLKNAQKFYNVVIHADATKIPFPDETFDYVVSSNLIGHIPAAQKDDFFSEMSRVLKRRGIAVHTLELDSINPLFTFGKKYPDLYKKYFLDQDGHYGLEFPKKVLKRFDNVGLDVEYAGKCWGFFWPTYEIIKRFDNEYREKSRYIDFLVRICKMINKNRYINFVMSCILGVASDLVEFFLPLEYGQGLMVIAKKR